MKYDILCVEREGKGGKEEEKEEEEGGGLLKRTFQRHTLVSHVV